MSTYICLRSIIAVTVCTSVHVCARALACARVYAPVRMRTTHVSSWFISNRLNVPLLMTRMAGVAKRCISDNQLQPPRTANVHYLYQERRSYADHIMRLRLHPAWACLTE